MTTWEPVLPGILLFRDSCNVYAIVGPDGALIVDAGTGAWIDHVAELPAPPVALVCTHFFRDHSAGAARAARELGIPVLVPERERSLFDDALEHHRARQTWLVYDNYWDHFAPVESIPVAGVLRDDERLEIAGFQIEVVPLPGATLNQVGVAFTPRGTDLRVVCSGETIHSPGRVPRLAPEKRSILGVLIHGFPLQPRSPKPWSSVSTRITFGRWLAPMLFLIVDSDSSFRRGANTGSALQRRQFGRDGGARRELAGPARPRHSSRHDIIVPAIDHGHLRAGFRAPRAQTFQQLRRLLGMCG